MSDIRKRYLESKATPETAPAERRPRGRRMTRTNAPHPKKPSETAIFQDAADILKITPKSEADIFGVTRQTVSKWMRGITPPKPGTFVILTKMLIEHDRDVDVMEKRINEHEQRLSAALHQAEEIRAQLKEIKHDVFAKGADK